MATAEGLAPWDRNNPREQDVPCISKEGLPKDIYDVIIDKTPELVETLDPSSLWHHLNRLHVFDREKQEHIEVRIK